MVRTIDLPKLVEARRDLPAPHVRRRIRTEAGVSQEQVARFVGVSQASVALWEAGAREPSEAFVARYVEALNIMRGGGP